MKSKTLGLFLASGSLLMMTILAAAYWDELGFGESSIPLAVTTLIAFGISLSGLVVGAVEEKNLKTVLAMIGHSIIIGFFIIMVIYLTTL